MLGELPSYLRTLLSKLQEDIDKHQRKLDILSEDIAAISTGMGILAEVWRRMNYEMESGTMPNKSRIGKYSIMVEADEQQTEELKIVITKTGDNCLRLDFLNLNINERTNHN